MATVMNVHSIDGWIKLRVCSEVWHTGVFGGCVVVKDPVVIPFDIIYFLGLQIMPLNLIQVEISTTQKQWTWQLRYSTECICEDKYTDKVRLKMLYPLFWTHDFCWIVCIKTSDMIECSSWVLYNRNHPFWVSRDQNWGYSSAPTSWLRKPHLLVSQLLHVYNKQVRLGVPWAFSCLKINASV